MGIVLALFAFSCKKDKPVTPPPGGGGGGGGGGGVRKSGPPNIIFLLADDMGYEMPTFDGGSSYNTTHLDSLAANSMVFTQCRATPLCSPSRVELLSGLYNYRNYTKYGWGQYDNTFTSYATMLKNNGYQTCVVGKWQLGNFDIGLGAVGFDKYCVVDENGYDNGYLYRSPTLLDELGVMPSSATHNKYSEDITSEYAFNFIDENKSKPFFIYYSFLLVHMPDQPTPLDGNFLTFDENLADTTYIKSMTHYLDLKVGALINKLKADSLDKNTIIVFTGDNGSLYNYHSVFHGKEVAGEKSRTTELGTHVPMFVYWPGHITPGTNNNLVDFSDFAPSFLDMAGIKNKPAFDGVSFYPQLFGQNDNARNWIYCYYDPFPVHRPPPLPLSKPISYAQDTEYKLYKTDQEGSKAGQFFHFTQDIEERHPLQDSQLTPAEVAIKQKLRAALSGMP